MWVKILHIYIYIFKRRHTFSFIGWTQNAILDIFQHTLYIFCRASTNTFYTECKQSVQFIPVVVWWTSLKDLTQKCSMYSTLTCTYTLTEREWEYYLSVYVCTMWEQAFSPIHGCFESTVSAVLVHTYRYTVKLHGPIIFSIHGKVSFIISVCTCSVMRTYINVYTYICDLDTLYTNINICKKQRGQVW
jgi:hypothetical protein